MTFYVFGAGGHGREIAWLVSQARGPGVALCHLVDDERYLSPPVNGHPVRLLGSLTPRETGEFVVAIGDPDARRRAADACVAAGLTPAVLVHPRAELSGSVTLGGGSVVCAGSVLTTDITLGRHVHINVGCTISHDAVLEDYATVSPGVHVAGYVRIERGALLGTGATVINGRPDAPIVIGAGAVVAAGAVVTGSVEPGSLVAGVPAARKR